MNCLRSIISHIQHKRWITRSRKLPLTAAGKHRGYIQCVHHPITASVTITSSLWLVLQQLFEKSLLPLYMGATGLKAKTLLMRKRSSVHHGAVKYSVITNVLQQQLTPKLYKNTLNKPLLLFYFHTHDWGVSRGLGFQGQCCKALLFNIFSMWPH